MTVENENGELRQLLEVKRGYRKDLAEFQVDLEERYTREFEDGMKRLKEQYMKRIRDVVFAEPAIVEVEAKKAEVAIKPEVALEVETKPKPAPQPEPTVQVTCPGCEAKVGSNDKFCSQCAYPLKEAEKDERSMDDWPVVSAGRKFRARIRS